MIQLECPSCHRAGSIRRLQTNIRLVCKKCHAVFHMHQDGRAVLGEPPMALKKADRSQKFSKLTKSFSLGDWKSYLPDGELSPKKGMVLFAGLGFILAIVLLLNRSPEGLDTLATSTVNAFVNNNDSGRLKAIATPSTAEFVEEWAEAVRPQLDKLRKKSEGSDISVSIVVIDQNKRKRKGQVTAFLSSGLGSVVAAQSTSTGGRPQPPLELPIFWILDRWGHWRLDGRQTLMATPQAFRTTASRPVHPS